MFWLILAALTTAWSAPVPPPGGSRESHFAGILRATKDLGNYNLFFELNSLPRHERHDTRELTAGAYYSVHPSVRFGLFYRRAEGLRHDRDWISSGGVWQWRETENRIEDLVIADVSLKDRVPWLENWIWEVKTRNFTNLYTGDNTTMVRTGLSYFWLREGELVANFFASYELHFESLERWAYFGALYHATEWLDMGPIGGFSWHTWRAPADYINRGGAAYEVTEESSFIGVLLLLTL